MKKTQTKKSHDTFPLRALATFVGLLTINSTLYLTYTLEPSLFCFIRNRKRSANPIPPSPCGPCLRSLYSISAYYNGAEQQNNMLQVEKKHVLIRCITALYAVSRDSCQIFLLWNNKAVFLRTITGCSHYYTTFLNYTYSCTLIKIL